MIGTVRTALAFKSTFCILLNPLLNSSSSISMKFFFRKWTGQITEFMGRMDFAVGFTCTNLTHERIHGFFFFFFFF